MRRAPRAKGQVRRPAPRRRKGERRRRRWWPWLLLLLVLLLALCCRDWSCAEPPPEPAPEPVLAGPPDPAPPPPAPAPTGRLARLDRPAFETAPQDPLPWLASFRMQVGARGPRLAECFVGVERPGALKWTTSVEPASGRVSDHELEPTSQSDPLTTEQRACVLAVLTEPPYRVETAVGRSTPSRVSLAIEF